jgi:signal transduction histidine kinase
MLRALSNSSHAMVRATDEGSFLADVCRIVVEDCGHAMVWIGYADDGPDKAIRPVAHAGFEAGYLETLHLTWADSERGRGPTGTAIRTGRTSACANMQTDPRFAPWREEAIRRGYASSIVCPLIADGRVLGAITIYSREEDPFLEDERRLIEELARDLSHGIASLRERAARREAEQAVRESEARLSVALAELQRAHEKAASLARFPQENPEPVLRLRSDLRVVYANAAALTCLSPLELTADGPAPEALAEPARRAQADGWHRCVVESGDRTFSCSFCRVGEEVNVYGQDVTDLRRAQDALRESEHRARELAASLQEADRRKNEFFGVLSHELRNPLAPVQYALQILDRAEPGSEQGLRAKEVIRRQAKHLGRLVDDLLDVTRISHGKIRLNRERLDLCELAGRVVDDQRSLFSAKQIALELRAEATPLWIQADPTRISQAIANLLQNAAKFTNAQGHVAVRVERRGERAAVLVADDGIGVAPELLPGLFEPFRQVDHSLARSAGGLGLGLALVKGLVEMHGGTVEGRSPGVGRGAEFTIVLPLAPDAAESARPPGPGPDVRTRRRVLVIDDSRDGADTLRTALELGGNEVEVAYDGREGLAKIRAHHPEVVFCDIGLPELDGYELARQVRSDPPPSPVLIALSGYALPEDRRKALEAGFDQHLGKPLAPGELDAVMAGITGSRP